VHELRLPSDPAADATPLPRHPSELPSGRDLRPGADGTWRGVFADAALSVSAAPIAHSCACVGYVLQEAPLPGKIADPAALLGAIKAAGGHPSLMRQLQQHGSVTLPDGAVLRGPPRRAGRKLALLGDTHDPAPLAALAAGADVLVHEATNAHVPGADPDTRAEDTPASVQARAVAHGHSTPQMAGAFARAVGAKRLLLNHFSARYKADKGFASVADARADVLKRLGMEGAVAGDAASSAFLDQAAQVAFDEDAQAAKIMSAIRDLAVEAYGSDNVLCARDFMTVDIEVPKE
jgi:ribonuclease Z